MNALLEEIANDHLKKDIPDFEVGDTVRVHVRIIEGDKERMQALTGTVIARKGSGVAETFSICRVAYGVSMERVFPLHSPRVAKIEVMRKGKTRRSKLYFLRGAQGKKARLAERIMGSVKKEKISAEEAPAEEPEVKAEEPKAEAPQAKEAEPKAEKPAEEPKKDTDEDKA